MNPIHVIQILEATGGGSRKHLRYITQALREAGHTVDLVLATRRCDPDFEDDLKLYHTLGSKVFLFDLKRNLSLSDLRWLRRFRAILKERRPQLVHSHCAKAGLIARLAVKSMGRKAPRNVHTPHSYFFQGFPGAISQCLGIRLERFLSRTGGIFCISEAETRLIAQHRIAPAERVFTGLNGLPPDFAGTLEPREKVRERFGLPDNVVAVGVFARLAVKKGHLWLLEAIQALNDETRRQAKFFFFGAGPLEGLVQRRIRKLGLADTVICTGYIPCAERLLPGMDLGVLPSYYEGLAYQLLETLAAGVPLIASDIPGNRFEFPGNPIQYIPVGDVPGLAGQLEKFIKKTPEHRAELGAQGQAWVHQHFPLKKQINALLDCYTRILS